MALDTTQPREPDPAGPQGVALRRKLGWAIGGAADNLIANTINAIAMPIYNIGMGVDPILLGYALALPRVLDAVTDTYVGNLSDNTRSRWGRRRPFILLGAVLSALFCVLMWAPPKALMSLTGLGLPALFWYVLITNSLYYLGYAIFLIPYNALGFELSSDYHERTRVQAWKFFFVASAGFLLPWLYRLSIFLGERFPVEGLRAEVAGVRWVGVGVGLLILLTAGLPALLCREEAPLRPQARIEFFKAVRLTLQNRVFVLFCAIVFIVQASLFVVTPLANYIWIYHVCGGSKAFASTLNGTMGTVNAVLGILSIAPVTWLATRWGKKETLLAGCGLSLVGVLTTWLLFTPKHPYLSILPQQIMCPGLTCVYVLTGSMIADICDVDEARSGLRREGMYGAAFAFLFKCGYSVVTVLTGYLLLFSGYSEKVVPGPAVILKLRLFFMLVPAAGILLAMALTAFYPLTERRLRQIRAEAQSAAEQQPEAATLDGAGVR